MKVLLTSLSEGQEAVVVEIAPCGQSHEAGFWGGLRCRFGWSWKGENKVSRGAAKRLADLGILPGTRIKVVRRAPFGGPIEVEVGGSRFMIGRGLASRIIVEV